MNTTGYRIVKSVMGCTIMNTQMRVMWDQPLPVERKNCIFWPTFKAGYKQPKYQK